MGEKRRRQRKFFRDNPDCCLCGGKRQSSCEDHLPPKSAFIESKWPHGYVAPSCVPCNNGSSDDDQIFSIISITFGDPTGGRVPKGDIERFVRGYSKGIPASGKRLIDKVRSAKRLGPYYGVTIDADHRASLERISRKIGKYLVFKHHSQIVQPPMLIGATIFLNSELHVADEIIQAFAPYRAPETGLAANFDKQFAYSIRAIEGGGWAVTYQMHAAFLAVVIICPQDRLDHMTPPGYCDWWDVDEVEGAPLIVHQG